MKAKYFSVLFDKAPTYQEIKDGSLKKARLLGVNELFSALTCGNSRLVSLVVGSLNTLLPILIKMADDLGKLGFRYSDDEQVYIKEEIFVNYIKHS